MGLRCVSLQLSDIVSPRVPLLMVLNNWPVLHIVECDRTMYCFFWQPTSFLWKSSSDSDWSDFFGRELWHNLWISQLLIFLPLACTNQLISIVFVSYVFNRNFFAHRKATKQILRIFATIVQSKIQLVSGQLDNGGKNERIHCTGLFS